MRTTKYLKHLDGETVELIESKCLSLLEFIDKDKEIKDISFDQHLALVAAAINYHAAESLTKAVETLDLIYDEAWQKL